jgi:hypothetical protein
MRAHIFQHLTFEGTVLQATREACKNQAFLLGEKVLAIQFHPEATEETVKDFVFYFKKDLVSGEYIQSENELLSMNRSNFIQLQNMISDILLFLTLRTSAHPLRNSV